MKYFSSVQGLLPHSIETELEFLDSYRHAFSAMATLSSKK